MEDMFYAIIGLAFIITLAVLAQKRRNKHFTKKCPKPTGLKYTGGCPCYDYKCPQCGHKFYN